MLQESTNLVSFPGSDYQTIIKDTFGDASKEANRPYRNSMIIGRHTLLQRFELGLLPPAAYCQLAFEMDEIGKTGPEKFDVDEFIDRWAVSTGFKFNKKTKEEEETFKKLSPAVVNRELLRLESVTKSTFIQEIIVQIDYNQG
jgi:hypothetical protein